MAFENFVGGVDCFGLFPRFALQFGAARKAVWTPGRRHFLPRFFDLRKRGVRLQFKRLAGVVDFVSHPSFIGFSRAECRRENSRRFILTFFAYASNPNSPADCQNCRCLGFLLGRQKF